jgi:hypothetical protein
MSAKLAVPAIVTETFRLTLDRRNDLLRVGLVFTIGFFALGAFMVNVMLPLMHDIADRDSGALAGEERYLPAMFIAVLVAEFLLLAIFAVGWHRFVLLGPARAGGGLGIGFGPRELRFFGKMWLCLLGLIVMSFVFAQVELVLARVLSANPYGFLLVASVGYLLLAAFVLARVAPAFAALSIDQPASFPAAWKATSGNGLQLLAIYLFIFVGWFLVTLAFGSLAGALGLGAVAPYALLFIGAVMTCVQTAMLVTVNALVYRRLMPGGAGAAWR